MTLRDIQIQAEKMGVQPETLRDWIKRKLIPADHTTGFQRKIICVQPSKVFEAIQSQRPMGKK